MEYFAIFLITISITAVSITFSYFAKRWNKALVFIPPFILLSFSAYSFLSGLQRGDLGAIALVLFGFIFLFSGLINLIVAALWYRPTVRR